MGEFPSVSLNTMTAVPIVLDPPIVGHDTVDQIRMRAASALGVHYKQISLVHGDIGELPDHALMSEALHGINGKAEISVILRPCQIKPCDYESYIDRDGIGFLKVDEIRREMFHRITFSEYDGHRGIGKGIPVETQPEVVMWPKPKDININMMPFIMGQRESIPDAYQEYWELIEAFKLPEAELGKVGYLTIHESLVPAGQSQRRAGLHIESPGKPMDNGGVYHEDRYDWGCGVVMGDNSEVQGGIYMASTVPNSTRIWNVQIRNPASVVGKFGDLEHIRDVLDDGISMEAGIMYWMTDATPHESLALQKGKYRQFFRLVTSSLTAWYPEHCSANPLGIVPDPNITKIVAGNRFEST